MAALMWGVSLGTALVIHAVTAPAVFAPIAWHYFRARDAREPLATASVLIFGVTWLTGELLATLPGQSVPRTQTP